MFYVLLLIAFLQGVFTKDLLKGPPEITLLYRMKSVEVGDRIELPCQATGRPPVHVKWSRPKTFCHNLDRAHFKQLQHGVAMVIPKAVKAVDQGVYCCEATNNLGNSSYFVFVSVLYKSYRNPPEIKTSTTVTKKTKGTKAVLSCHLNYVSQIYAAVFWEKDNKRVRANTKRMRVKTIFYKPVVVDNTFLKETASTSLELDHVTARDAGNYTCGVATHLGFAKATIKFVV